MQYRESLTSPLNEVSTLMETVKVNSHRKARDGEMVSTKAGVFMLIFDNTHSRYLSINISLI